MTVYIKLRHRQTSNDIITSICANDMHNVSKEAYKEMSGICEELPQFDIVQKRLKHMNDTWKGINPNS